jgi:hypothetical protein
MFRHRWNALPRLIRFMLVHFCDGMVMGWAFGLALIWFDVGGVGALLAEVDRGPVTAMFFFHGGLLFGTLVMSVALMTMGDGPD